MRSRLGLGRCVLVIVSLVLVASFDALAQSNKVYWTEVGQSVTRIRRADLNGSNVQTLLFDPVGGGTGNADLLFPTSITMDSAGGKFYYVDFSRDRVSRANIDGTSNEVLIQLPSSSSPRAVTVDPLGGFLYFSDFGT